MDQPAGSEKRITFSGTGSEYFRIWIVNILLSIVTLGIYSAWAKVRRNKYFYGCTQLDGSSFEYHGNPVAILKGRLVALAAVLGYNLAFKLSALAGFAMLGLMFAVFPWLAWRSLQFKLYNTSYRGIRFGFDGSAGGAYRVYLLMPLLTFVTFMLFGPKAHHSLKKFQHTESRYGAERFGFHATAGSFYKAYFKFFVPLLIACFALGMVAGAAMPASAPKQAAFGASFLAGYLSMLLIAPVFMALIQNLIWNNTTLGQHQFRSELKWGRLLFISLTNLLGIVCTLGLFIPFAQVRALRYRLESATMIVAGNLDAFVADTGAQVSAVGEGVADLLDFDLSM